MSTLLSIIVCHRDQRLLDAFKQNVEQTIGVEHEWVVIDNSENRYSIFEAYNLGVKQSKGDILCFSHEDIAFHSQDWGQSVFAHFEDPETGMIGVAGGNGFPKAPSWWWNTHFGNDHLVNLLQVWSTKEAKQAYNRPVEGEPNKTIMFNNPGGANRARAACVDGLWFCVRKSLFAEQGIRFDSDYFKGFHCYDSDCSLQVNQHSNVFVVFDILIEHFSDANANREFYESTFQLFLKWKDRLPISYKLGDDADALSQYSYKGLLEYFYVIRSSGLYTESEIRDKIQSALRASEADPLVVEYQILFWWKLLGYDLARFPNFVARKVLGA